jgi:hypothetical protein
MVHDISQKVLIQALREMEDGVVVADGSGSSLNRITSARRAPRNRATRTTK